MNALEFFELVKGMRTAQRAFFRHRLSADMEIAMEYERRVDAEIIRAEEVARKREQLPGMGGEKERRGGV